jgi:hypothetical protein
MRYLRRHQRVFVNRRMLMTDFDKFLRSEDAIERHLLFQEQLRQNGQIEWLKRSIRRYTIAGHLRHARRWNGCRRDPRLGLIVSLGAH